MRDDLMSKGWSLKIVFSFFKFSFHPWCVQSELSLVKHGQKSKVRTVLKRLNTPRVKRKRDIFKFPSFTSSY